MRYVNFTTINDVGACWSTMWGDSPPEDYDQAWLQDQIQEAELRYEEVTAEWLDDLWGTVFQEIAKELA